MSVVKYKNNTKHEQPTTINKKQLRPHITENIGLIEQHKIVMVCDRSTPTQDMSPESLTQPKKTGLKSGKNSSVTLSCAHFTG